MIKIFQSPPHSQINKKKKIARDLHKQIRDGIGAGITIPRLDPKFLVILEPIPTTQIVVIGVGSGISG